MSIDLSDTTVPTSALGDELRVAFRQPVSIDGFVDAAWWPHSLDLAVELAPLLDSLWCAGREIVRVTYNVAAWDDAPRSVLVDGRRVRLGWFRTGDPSTIRLSDAWGKERIDVLVIPPDTDPATAARALDLAASGDLHPAPEILARAAQQSGR